MNGILEELKRRNVFRVGIAYVVVSWIIVQVIDTISGPLSLPDWLDTVVIVLLMAGLPIALLLAWAFELTPEGIKRSDEVDADESITASTGQKLNYTIIAALVLALGFFAWERQRLVSEVEEQMAASEARETAGEAESVQASIAVLPFVNMSEDVNQEHFSDGISEELLNVLAKVPEFRVAARTSSFQFKGRNLDISAVASQLKVDHVLEGSVRKAGDTVRITAQLIEADSGFHLWSDTYDRKLDDVFAIQDEISAAIVAELSKTLGITVDEIPRVAAVTEEETYNLYLLGQQLIRNRNAVDIEEAIGYLDSAIELDPAFAPAYAQLGLAWYLLSDGYSTYGSLPFSETLPRAETLANKALELSKDLPEALGLLGLIAKERGNASAALALYEKALSINPSLTDVRNWYATELNFSGRYAEGDEQMRIALEYDPLSMLLLNNYALRLAWKEDADRLGPVIDRIRRLDDAKADHLMARASFIAGNMRDGFEYSRQAYFKAPGEGRYRLDFGIRLADAGLYDDARVFLEGRANEIMIANMQEDYATAIDLLLESESEMMSVDPADYYNDLAYNYFAQGDFEKARSYATRVIEEHAYNAEEVMYANFVLGSVRFVNGEPESGLALMRPQHERLKSRLEARRVPLPFLFWNLGIQFAAMGDMDAAYESFAEAARKGYAPDELSSPIAVALGLDKDEKVIQLVQQSRAHRDEQVQLILSEVCSDLDGEGWRPSQSTCSSIAL